MSEKTTITSDEHLKTFAVFMMAKHHSNEAGRYFEALARMLGFKDRTEEPGYISDAIWGWESLGSPAEFDKMLGQLGIVVEDATPESETND